jgi:hypothetical protein
MAAQGWTRRLDDRVDAALARRFGLGLTSWGDWSLGRQIAMSAAVAGAVGLVLLVALVLSGHAGRTPVVLGPILGTVVGSAIGGKIRARRKRG